MSVKYKDYYEILGVERNSSDAAIKKAYRKLARQFHPDVNQTSGAQARFQEISEAYEVLGDPEKRKRYDQLGANWQQGQDFTPPPGWENVHFEFGGNGAPGFGFSGQGGFSDFFASIFGDMADGGAFHSGKGFRRSPPRAANEEVELALSLEEAWNGGKKRISVYNSAGASKTYNLNIPARIRDGAKLRMKNQGSAGDLIVRISIKPHPRFRVSGADLETTLNLSPPEAVLGTKAELPLLNGRAELRVPPGTPSGKKFKLKGQGLGKQGGRFGDLLVTVAVEIPAQPTPAERDLYEKLLALRRNRN